VDVSRPDWILGEFNPYDEVHPNRTVPIAGRSGAGKTNVLVLRAGRGARIGEEDGRWLLER